LRPAPIIITSIFIIKITIAMMRHGFGGHPFGKDEAIEKERRSGRVGEFYQNDKKEDV